MLSRSLVVIPVVAMMVLSIVIVPATIVALLSLRVVVEVVVRRASSPGILSRLVVIGVALLIITALIIIVFVDEFVQRLVNLKSFSFLVDHY